MDRRDDSCQPESSARGGAEVGSGQIEDRRAGINTGRRCEAPRRSHSRLIRGYLPADEKGRRLGSSPRPGSILTLRGDVGRGEKLFWSSAVNCGSCHKIGDRGVAIGPDLSNIGKLRPREDLLKSMLEPSHRIEPNYSAYLARTVDGSVVTGLLVKRDESGVVLRDGQNKEISLAASDIEQLRPSQKSLMPDGQMAGLTLQEAADLLEYLANRK